MLIGELSQKTGLSKDTIRFYEKTGLIVASDRQAGTRVYKEYSSDTAERLMLIGQGKKLGFRLNEIKQLIDDWTSGAMSKQEQIQTIVCKINEIDEKMQQLNAIKAYLVTKLSKLNEADLPEPYSPTKSI
jgi:MerR family Zn(II)-responsive transcriptional regulator of zntA